MGSLHVVHAASNAASLESEALVAPALLPSSFDLIDLMVDGSGR